MQDNSDNYYYEKLAAEDTAPVGEVLYYLTQKNEAIPYRKVITTPYRDVRYGMMAVMEEYAQPSITNARPFKGMYIRKARQPIMYQLVYRHGQTLSLGPMKDSLVEAKNLALSWRGGTCVPIAMMQRDVDGIWRLVCDYSDNKTGATIIHG